MHNTYGNTNIIWTVVTQKSALLATHASQKIVIFFVIYVQVYVSLLFI